MRKHNYALHLFLFLITVLTTLIAGSELTGGRSFLGESRNFDEFLTFLGGGVEYSFAFLAFLSFHEFGHYFTAVAHGVRTSLPYYIPIYIPFSPINIGSFGAVIRLKQVPESRRKFFDVGVAGPLAGFVVSVILIIYGLSTLPDPETYIYQIHPEYPLLFGGIPSAEEVAVHPDYGIALSVGSNLLFEFLSSVIPGDTSLLPPAHELMHYPWLFVGFLTLFFTALNLLPIGQLDGGHVIYGLFGAKIAGRVSRFTVLVLVMLGGTGVMNWDAYNPLVHESMTLYLAWNLFSIALYVGLLYLVFQRILQNNDLTNLLLAIGFTLALQSLLVLLLPWIAANEIWLLYALLATRAIGVDHPVAMDDTPLDFKRKILAWLAILIFILCFTPLPIQQVL